MKLHSMFAVLPGSYQEPPPDAEELMSPDAIAAYAKVAAAVDMEVADKALCQALKVRWRVLRCSGSAMC